MSGAQFKRLFLVLILPLLGLGLWFAEAEILFPNHYIIECSAVSAQCSSRLDTRARRNQMEYEEGGVYIDYHVRLSEGVFAQIVEFELDRVDRNLDTPKAASTPKRLSISSRVGAQSFSRCQLGVSGDSGLWYFNCPGKPEMTRSFKFVDAADTARFVVAIRLAKDEIRARETHALLAYGAAVCAPLLGFLLLSGLIALLGKIVGFVRYGKAKKAYSEGS